MAATRLTKTFSGASNRKTFTFSFWVKRTKISTGMYIANAGAGGNPEAGIEFNSDDTFTFWEGGVYNQKPTRKFRDVNAWYHIVVAVDTTQATEANRVKIYVNGVQETVMTTNTFPSQNADLSWNTTLLHTIGAYYGGSNYFDGILSHFHFIDGTAYAASDFGESDSTSGIWKPKTSPSVTYGSNGFFLKFENSGAMGTDSSGNSNTFTVSGTMTQNTDTPTNNACIINGVSNEASGFTFANANTSATFASGSWKTIQGTLGANKGKWYYETKWNGTGAYMAGWTSVDFMNKSPVNYVGHTHAEPSYAIQASDGSIYYSTSSAVTQDDSGWGDTFTSSNVIGCAIDIDNGKLYWSKDGVWMNSGVPTSGSTGTGAFNIADTATNYFWNPVMSSYNSAQGMFNFVSGYFGTTQVSSANADANGHGAFEYAVPSGYYALNTKNLKEFG
jgi:hypothetical protein